MWNTTLKVRLAGTAAILLLAACASLLPAPLKEKVASAVARYCAAPLSERQIVRQEVNELTAPNAIKITCVGDPPES